MNIVKRLLRSADRIQQDRPWLGFPVAAWKKFGDDHAGNLAALISYYAFASLFPLLLVLVTVLDIVLRHDAALRHRVLTSALKQYPGIGNQLSLHSLPGAGLALVIGLVGTFLGARGVASAVQNALNAAWEVPFFRRSSFPWSLLRNLGLIGLVGPAAIATIFLSGIAGGTGHLLTGTGAHLAALAVSLVLNVGVFWLAFRLGTAREIATRDLRLGAIIAAVAWQALQYLAGYLIGHKLATDSSLYGAFGVVLGLLAWFYLQAQITLYAVEINVVQVRGLWPRSLAPPPLTPQDVRAHELYALAGQRRADLLITLHPVNPHPAAGSPPDPSLPADSPAGDPSLEPADESPEGSGQRSRG